MTDETFLEKTLKNLRGAWQNIAGTSWGEEAASLRPDLPEGDVERLLDQMRACLERKGGEVSARARAAALGRAYLALDAEGRERFLRVLAENFDVDGAAVDAAVDALGRVADAEAHHEAEKVLRGALEPPRVRLLTQFNALPEGVKFLVDLRAELLERKGGDPVLGGLEDDLKGLLATWFDVDFLELRRIDWDTAPAALLEKLIAYEAVHAIRSWDDLKNRLDSDRRCFAFFHPRMPDEPLIFVEVALVDGMASNVQELLDEDAPVMDPRGADTAIFYSISNAQKGLAGISFGNFLIKRVVDHLIAEFPGLKTFATLSPVPGFRKWLARSEAGALEVALPGGTRGPLAEVIENPLWCDDEVAAKALEGPLMRACARYLVQERSRKGRALDPVAHFHLSNGARLERVNWMGDCSAKGVAQSAGIMVNYRYRLDNIEANHEAYTGEPREVVASSAVKGLVKG